MSQFTQKISFRSGVLIVAAAVVFSFSGGAAVLAQSPNNTLQQDVNAIRDIGTTGVLAVTSDGNTFTQARAGTSIRGTTLPVNWDSHVRIGSNTKTFVATVMLQLEAEGKLSLNDTVERWLPGVVQGHGNQGDHITIKNLLQHTSGLYDYTWDEDFWSTLETPAAFYQNRFNSYTPAQLVGIAVSHAPSFAPGAKWEYSNTNYIVAGMIIEAATGKTWSQQVKDRIITPLGLSQTSEPGNNPFLPYPHPRGYQLFGTDGTYTDVTEHNMTWGGAAGSLVSSPRDVNVFFKALMKGQLLPPPQLAKMQDVVYMGKEFEEIWPGASYGLGIIRINLPCGGVYWSHGGDVLGYNNTNGITPDGEKSAMVASSTNTFSDAVFAENSIRTTNDLIVHALCGDSSSPSSMPPAHASTDGALQAKRLMR